MGTSSIREGVHLGQHPAIYGWLASCAVARPRPDELDCGVDAFREPAAAEPERTPRLRVFPERGYPLPALAALESSRAIFDGVLYNRSTLLEDFAPVHDRTPNDAEVILRAYLRRGVDVLPRVKGIFALVIWDGGRDVLLAARDPLGMYPLFYADAGAELLLSTSVDALVGHPRCPKSVDRAVLATRLWHFWPRMEDTYYASVKRVPPGHALRVDRTARKVIRHWDPGPPEEPIRWISEDDVEQFEGLLDQAVERCLAWGPTAMYLSGGLDSATVVAVAADRAAQDGLPPPLALSLIFPDPDCNEEVIQRGVAQVLGLPQVLAPFDEAVGPAGLIPAALEVSRTWPFPLFNVWFPAYRHLALEAKRQGRRSILTGSGGDEWLTISPFLAADLVRGADVRGFYALWQNLRRSYPVGGARLAHHLLWRYGVRPLLLERFGALSLREGLAGLLPLAWGSGGAAWPARGPSMPAWLAPDAALREDVRSQVLAHLAAQRRVQGFYLRDGRRLLDQPVLAEFKEDTFEAGRRSGILQLHPFWDADLVDFLYRIPPKLLVRQGTSKGLVRGMLASRFPELGFARQRKGTAERFAASLSLKDGARAWDRLGGAPALADLGIVEPRALGRAMDETLAHHRFRNAHLVWDVLHLEAWLQAHQSSKGS